jgi:hypothetical protein
MHQEAAEAFGTTSASEGMEGTEEEMVIASIGEIPLDARVSLQVQDMDICQEDKPQTAGDHPQAAGDHPQAAEDQPRAAQDLHVAGDQQQVAGHQPGDQPVQPQTVECGKCIIFIALQKKCWFLRQKLPMPKKMPEEGPDVTEVEMESDNGPESEDMSSDTNETSSQPSSQPDPQEQVQECETESSSSGESVEDDGTTSNTIRFRYCMY